MAGKSNGGEVEYLLVADDSNLDSDLEKANQKVKKAAKKSADESVKIEEEKTKDIKKESDKVVKNAEKSADDVVSEWKDAGKEAAKALSKISDDDVEFDVNANTSKAESKIKSVSRDKSIDVDVNADVSDAEDAIKGLDDVAKETGDEVGASLSKNIGNAIKSSFTDAADSSIPLVSKIGELTSGLSGAQVAAIGAGAAAAGMGVLAVGAANDMQGAMNSFLAETGKSREETERYQGILENIYANNYGESFEDIASAMAEVRTQIGPVVDAWDDTEIQGFTESAFALRDTFGYDITESVRAANTMMEQFGMDGQDAFDLIATGAQNGLDYSGELLDSINEYSVQFAKMGLYGEDMFAIFQKGADSGAFNLDKVGDAIKEMSIRVIDGSETTKQGFDLIGLNADEMAAKFAAGGDTAKEAFNQTLDALAALEDPIAQNTAGVDLMGTMWEDLGPEAVTALADIEYGAYDASDAMEQIKDIKYDDLGSQFEELKRNVELLLVPLGEALIPLLSTLAEAVLPVVTELLGPLIESFANLVEPIILLVSSAIQPLITAFIDLIQTAIQPLMPVIQALMTVFSSVMNSIFGTVTGVVGNITNIFKSLTDFIKNVFTGNWRGAWENVKNIFSNAISGLAAIFKAPMNAIVDGWNSLASSIGSVKVPEWVPIAGGKTFSLPRMSRLKVGIDYVPSDMFPAFLDEGEWVLTKEEANLLRSLGGLDGVKRLLSSGGGIDMKSVSVQPTYDKNLIRAIMKIANRPVASYFNVDSHTVSKTFAVPMDNEIQKNQKFENMLKGVK